MPISTKPVNLAHISTILSKVPVKNVALLLNKMPVKDVTTLISTVALDKIIDGASLLTANQIKQVRPEKLRLVLTHGNLQTVRHLQNKYTENQIIVSLNALSNQEIKDLLTKDNFLTISNTIDNICGIINHR